MHGIQCRYICLSHPWQRELQSWLAFQDILRASWLFLTSTSVRSHCSSFWTSIRDKPFCIQAVAQTLEILFKKSSNGNGFSHLWSGSVHVFPSIHLIFKVITKFLSDQVFFGTLITPYWPGIPNLPIIFPFLTSDPLFLSANPLQGPRSTHHPFHFAALTISCATAMTQEFLKTLHVCRKDNDASPILSKEWRLNEANLSNRCACS